MATVRTGIVNRAFRMLGAYGSGETPTDDDADVALEALISMLTSFVNDEVFGPITDVSVEADYEAGENERVNNLSDDEIDVTLPASITDACTGEERGPRDRAVVIVPAGGYNFFDASLGAWVTVEDLTLNSPEPLAGFGLAPLLAVRIAPEFQIEPRPELIGMAASVRQALARHAPQQVTTELSAVLRAWSC